MSILLTCIFWHKIAQVVLSECFWFSSLNFVVKFEVIFFASLEFSAPVFSATLLTSALKLLTTLDSKSCNFSADKFTFLLVLTTPGPSITFLSPTWSMNVTIDTSCWVSTIVSLLLSSELGCWPLKSSLPSDLTILWFLKKPARPLSHFCTIWHSHLQKGKNFLTY